MSSSRSRASAQPPPSASKSMIRPSAPTDSQKAERFGAGDGRAEIGAARPVPRRGRLDRAILVGDQQQAAGRVEDVGEGLDHPLAERRRLGPGRADRLGEAQPFGAIVVAMLEEMLGDLDLGPAARPARRQQDHRRDASSPRAAQPAAPGSSRRRNRAARSPASPSPRDRRRWRAARGSGRSRRATGGSASGRPCCRRSRTAARSAPAPARASRTGPAPRPGRNRRWCRG